MRKIALLNELWYGIMSDMSIVRRGIGLELLIVFQLCYRYALNDTILSIAERL